MGLLGFTCLASQVSGHGWEVHFPNSEENCLVLEGSRQDSTQHQGDLCSQSHYGQRGAKEGKLATKHEVVWESGHGCCGACDGCYGAYDGNGSMCARSVFICIKEDRCLGAGALEGLAGGYRLAVVGRLDRLATL